MSYASITAIRQGAGMLKRVENETPSGVADGSNKDFFVEHRPMVDGNFDDNVDISDVMVFVNGINVSVASIVTGTGKVSLTAAPANSASVTIDYFFSPLTDEYIQTIQSQVDSWADSLLAAEFKTPLSNEVPGVVVSACVMYGAGLILTGDWGSNADGELTSKDGFMKLKTAKTMLMDHVNGKRDERLRNARSNGSGSSVSTVSTTGVFDAEYNESRTIPVSAVDDDLFFNRR